MDKAERAQSVKLLSYGLEDGGSDTRLPAGARSGSVLHSVHTDPEAQVTSYPVGTGGSFKGIKRTGYDGPSSI
jgi:hypothetical protein